MANIMEDNSSIQVSSVRPTSSFTLPKPVSCLVLHSKSSLLVGSEDGCLRLYALASGKVQKAIRGLNDPVSSACCMKPKNAESEVVWIACGTKVLCFKIEDSKMIMSLEDVIVQLQLGEDDEDDLNELAVNRNDTFIAFGTDAGAVGVIDVSTNHISRMKVRHENICGSISFIPDRPNELISGGYDSAILHFDFQQGSLLSRFDIAAPPPSSKVSLSPPFVLTMALSVSGLAAVGTADGRVWISTGGEKVASGGKKRRSRKWEGLKEDEGIWLSVAEGPVVAVSFVDSTSLLTCTLLGALAMYSLTREEDRLVPKQKWIANSKDLAKVNTMSTDADCIAVGGFNTDGRGVFNIWSSRDAVLAAS